MDEINRRIDTALKDAVRQRNYRRVRDRALSRLKKLYPDDYARLFEEERARDEAEGRSWKSIHGRASDSPGVARHTAFTSTQDKPDQAGSNGGKESNLG